MAESLLTIFKFFVLALLYLFFFRVLKAVWTELREPAAAVAGAPAAAPTRETRGTRRSKKGPGTRLDVVEPAERVGVSYELGDELTVGRAAGCHISLDDTYVSQLHARVFRRDGQVMVEDLGSTNGTYLNRRRVEGPMVMRRSDRLQVGQTVMELR